MKTAADMTPALGRLSALSTPEFWMRLGQAYWLKSRKARGEKRQRCEQAAWVCLLWWAEKKA